jgi:hypothetical protein
LFSAVTLAAANVAVKMGSDIWSAGRCSRAAPRC